MFGNPYSAYPFMGAQIGQQAPFMQGAMSAQPAQNQQPSAGPAFLQVATAKDFDSVTIQPGRQALIMAQNEPFLAFKNADAMGMVTTTYYRLEQVTPDQVSGPAVEYVTRQEFQQTIQQMLDGLKQPTRTKKEVAAE